jgi:phospholipid/cholesterol/gamma-HCH transport system permease protein
MTLVLRMVESLGRGMNTFMIGLGGTLRFTGRAYVYGFVGLVKPQVYDRRELTRQVEAMGARSLPLVLFVAFLIGAGVMTQTVPDFERRGVPEVAPGVLAITITRFIAPVITALLFAGRVGASLSAELGSMKIGEELEALRAMAVNPLAFVVAPRVMAVGFALAGLTLIFQVVALFGGYVMGATVFGIDGDVFTASVRQFIVPWDVIFAMIKAFAFAVAIAAVACHQGFRVEGGSAELGRATMKAVVLCQAAIIAVDLIAAMINNVLQAWGIVPIAPV